jgi:predicted nucleic acid-binding protein
LWKAAGSFVVGKSTHPGTEAVAEALRNAGSASERPDLTVDQILAWADAHHAATGAWPNVRLMAGLGPVEGASGETWKGINVALALGLRGLAGDSSLAELLAAERGVPADLSPQALAGKLWTWEQEHFPVKKPRILKTTRPACPALTESAILAWADAHHAATGKWPRSQSGTVDAAPFEVTWAKINSSLHAGARGLPGGSSLPRLLAEHRGAPIRGVPLLEIEQVLAWADAHHAATGKWPHISSGTVRAAPVDVTWAKVDSALRQGGRGLPGGSSLARLLTEHRGVPNPAALEPLSIEQILDWADAHHAATGSWPKTTSGTVRAASYEITWIKVDSALRIGQRGLPEGPSLVCLLAEHRGAPNPHAIERLSLEQILNWADAHHAATGEWPNKKSGTVRAAPFEVTWAKVDASLFAGVRGLVGGSSLPRLLAERRGVRNRKALEPLTIEQILDWADAHHAATGKWPAARTDPIPGSNDETWRRVDSALVRGARGLPGGQTLACLLVAHRGTRGRFEKASGGV